MDAKDLQTDSIDRESNGYVNYQHSDTQSLCSNQNYVDSNVVPKMDVQTSRPCAVIGPDRMVSQPLSNLECGVKKNYTEWNYKDNSACPPLDSYEKISKPHQLRNISPRQTYQENMQRVMMPPHVDTMKISDQPTNFTNPRNITNHMADPKIIDVPYNVPHTPIEQRNFGTSEVYIPQPTATIMSPHGWAPSNAIPGRTYPQFSPSNMYRYPEYSNHTTSYPVPITHSHRVIPEETSHMYSNQFYRPGNIRYEPYPSSKDRLPHVRYEYINNYPISCNPRTYTSHKVITPQSYTTYNQVPFKYLRPHVSEIPPERFQRPINPMHAINSTHHNHEFTPNYASTINANRFPSNITYPNENMIRPKQFIKNNSVSKIYPDYDPSLVKHCHQPENIYTNKMMPANRMKESVITNLSSLNVQPTSHLLHYQRNINEVPNLKNSTNMPQFKTTIDNVNHGKLHSQFSHNTLYLDSSPNFSTMNTQNVSQEGCAFINQSSTGKRKSMESNKMLNPAIYNTCDVIYDSHTSPNELNRESSHNKVKLLTNKNIDVRQFLQMWNEGDEENIDGNGTNPASTVVNSNGSDLSMKSPNNIDQLYVLDLVNVPTEELGKYEHIEKVSKLPDNIKGYNHIELLQQFEKVLENSNVKYKYVKSEISTNSNKVFHPTDNKSIERPLSPLDVEAKISQSVIHKEVGCNFEIKPCSPKGLTVDIVAPAQVPSIERQIQKVVNPHIQSLPPPLSRSESSDDCDLEHHTLQLKQQREEPSSCKLTEINGSDSLEIKTNYNLQEFNTNSGVCLASLPRLDNDIEFNFPEVNQQFLDANKIESTVNKLKNTNTVYPFLNEKNNNNALSLKTKLQSSTFNKLNKVTEETIKHNSIDIKNTMPPNCENAKESIKLSKFRKVKNNVSDAVGNTLSNIQCTDNSVIKINENKSNPALEVDTILDLDKSRDDLSSPINLSSTKLNVIQYITNFNAVQNDKKSDSSKNMSTNEAINLAVTLINNQDKNTIEGIMEKRNISEECLLRKKDKQIIQSVPVEGLIDYNLPYVDKSAMDPKDSMEIDKSGAEEESGAKKVNTSCEVISKDEEINISDNVVQLAQNSMNPLKNKCNEKLAVIFGESCIENISDHSNCDTKSKPHKTDKSYNLSYPNKSNFSVSFNDSDKKKIKEKSDPNCKSTVNIFDGNNIYHQTYTHNDTLSNKLLNNNGTSKINTISNKNDNELHPYQEQSSVVKNRTEHKIVENDLETELPFDSSSIVKFSENSNSLDQYNSDKTDITIEKGFQLVDKQQDNLRSIQDDHKNIEHKIISTTISADEIAVNCLKLDFTNKEIINHENIASLIPCNLDFSVESEEVSDKITLASDNIENPVLKQSPRESVNAQKITQLNIAENRLHIDKNFDCENNITDIDMLGSNKLVLNSTIVESSKHGASNNSVEVVVDNDESQGENKELKSDVHAPIFGQIFSKEFFSSRVQNLLINLEGIIVKKKLISLENMVLSCDTKEICFNENFKGTESQNIQSVITPNATDKLINKSQHEVLEKVMKNNGVIEESSDIILKLNAPGASEAFENLSTVIKIKENNQPQISHNCVENNNFQISQMLTSIHPNDLKDLVEKKGLKCCKCESSCSNNLTSTRSTRRKLRSLSESDIYSYDLDFSKNMDPCYKLCVPQPKKIKKDVNLTLDIDNRNSVFSTNCRRNSIGSILTDQNLSVCILIDSNCLITDECLNDVGDNEHHCFQEDEEILCSNEESVSTTIMVPIGHNTIQEQTLQTNETDVCVDKDYGDYWVDDVGCIETVVSDEIIDSNENSLQTFEKESDNILVEPSEAILDKKFDSAKIKAIYGSNILKSDIKFVESLYKTPQMDVKNKLKRTNSPIEIEEESKANNISYVHGKTSFNVVCDFRRKSSLLDKAFKNEKESLTLNTLNAYSENISDNHTINTARNHKGTYLLSTNNLTYCDGDYESDSSMPFPTQTSTSSIETHISELPTPGVLPPIQENCFSTSASSSPEVSSTTSEEKSNILVKICEYETSRASCVKPENESVFFKKGLRCKLTEVNHYGKSGHSSATSKTLITKAAQKYIPPQKQTIDNLKIRLPLPEHSLRKLKQLKISKDIPKSKNNNFISNRDMESNKKTRPNFEDVLRSIDEVQYKLHKSKCKIKQAVPKVIIKKSENGSHYASTSKLYNPDLTGRKWQPWVFLEKNYFIDKMAMKKNSKAIYCHKKNTYIIADRIENNEKREPSGTSTKLIISRPKTNLLKMPLKYTIRWKHL